MIGGYRSDASIIWEGEKGGRSLSGDSTRGPFIHHSVITMEAKAVNAEGCSALQWHWWERPASMLHLVVLPWDGKFSKCPCQFHLDMKQDAILRTKLLRDDFKQNYFEEQLRKCGNDMKCK